MDQRDFSKYWKKRKSEKYYSDYVPNFKKRKIFEAMINELSKQNIDFRKMKYEHRVVIMERIFGNSKKQYSANALNNEIQNAINIGRQRVGL
jgi:transcriptional antiterminator